MALTGKQKSFLRSKAHHLNPIFQIGKNGMNPDMLKQIGEALEKRELIKVSILQNSDEEVSEVAETIEQTVGCQAVQKIGRVIVLFKPSSQEKYRKVSLEIPRA